MLTIFFLVFRFPKDSVNGMLHVKVRKRSMNVVKILFITERKMIDFVGWIKLVALVSQVRHDIFESTGADLEATRHSIHLEMPFYIATLLLFKLFLNSVSYLASIFLFFESRFCAQYFTVFIDSVFFKITHDILFVSSQNVMYI